MNNNKIITFEIPKGYRFKHRLYNDFVFEKMNDRPTDIKEASEILEISMFQNENYRKKQLDALQQLLIFRDAWWKMADDWKPDYITEDNQRVYIITTQHGYISKNTTYHWNYILAFPTEEMRDTFYENFKDLIEQCKELL